MTLSNILKLKLRRLNMSDLEMKDLDDKTAQEIIDGLDPKPEPAKTENKQVETPKFKPLDQSTERMNERKNTAPENPYSAEELFDPLQTDVSRLNLEDPAEGRILKLYDDNSPEGRIF